MVYSKKNKKFVILDSSIWISYLYKNDSQHKRAIKLIEKLDKKIMVPEYVIIEVATILRNKKYYKEALIFATDIINNPSVFMPSAGLAKQTTELFIKMPKSRLSFIDTALLVLSCDYEIITFDKHLERANKARK